MARIYGHKWTSIAECDDGTWEAGLQDLTPQHLAVGLGRLLQEASEWPPSLPEFRDLCLGEKDENEWQQNTKAYINYNPQKKLTAPKNKELARKEMLEIRKKLNN